MKKIFPFSIIIVLVWVNIATAKTYNSTDVPKTILPFAIVTSTINISDTFSISDVNVTIDITHIWVGDLWIYIKSPDGTNVTLSRWNGGSGDNYTNTTFDDEASTSIVDGSPPFTGSFRPEEPLSAFDGKTTNGTWTLYVDNWGPADGTLNSWSLTVPSSPIIERISPEIGQISGGDEVTITGNYFQDGATVTIGGNPAEVVSVSEIQITAKTPPGALGITDVVVTNPDGDSSTLLRGFAYIPVYGDVSNNGTVSAYDAALILQFVVGLISEFPVQQLLSPEQKITPRNYTVSIPKQSAKAGNKIQVPIYIDDVTGLFAGGISISYDASVLKAVNALPTEMLNGSYWKANVSFPGEARFAFAKTELTQGSGSLLTIEFQILPDTEGKSSPLSFSSINLSNSLNIGKNDGLVNVLPAKTVLLPNYPNPFNPETFLPYKLSQDAPVAIYIYSSNGQLARKLSLGYQSAGVYVSKENAARWDGKDSLGQKVASGVYFYTLQAGEFRATQKMVIMK
ncbi:MAG: proprotein convertase P-domain-containing protein [Deltaproteobacteria bacterium]|nr:proprotein convertase P-domain-containing protein [Deltaproteobacteria bacterium]